RATGGEDPEERRDEALGLPASVRVAPPFLPEGACSLLTERDELAHAPQHVVLVGGAGVDLDQAQDGCEPPQEAEPRALHVTRGIGLVSKVGVLGIRRDLVVGDGGPGAAERFLADLLAELVEAEAHTRSSTRTGWKLRPGESILALRSSRAPLRAPRSR